MYLNLSTIDVWSFQDQFSPTAFLLHLHTLLQQGDIVAFGAYDPSPRFLGSPLARQATTTDVESIYTAFFDLNRDEHPMAAHLSSLSPKRSWTR